MIFFAQAPDTFTGQWWAVAMVAIGAVVGLFTIIAYFATKRDVETLEKRLDSQDAAIALLATKLDSSAENIGTLESEMTRQGERRSTALHNRINPLVENTAALKAGLEAHNENFRNFTEIIKALMPEPKGNR